MNNHRTDDGAADDLYLDVTNLTTDGPSQTAAMQRNLNGVSGC